MYSSELPLSVVTVQITDLGEDRYQVETFFADKKATRIAPAPLKRGEIFYYTALLERGHSIPLLEYQHRLRELGNRLCAYVIPGNTFQRLEQLAASPIIISLNLEQAGLLTFLPWEVMWHPEQGYLATHRTICLTRCVNEVSQPAIIPVIDQLHILRVAPAETPPHDGTVNTPHIHNLMSATLPSLISRLEAQDYHILQLHLFMSEDEQNKRIRLSLEDPRNSPEEVVISPQSLAEWISIHTTVRLIVIIPKVKDTQSSMAIAHKASLQLLHAGISAIVVTPPSLESSLSILYHALQNGESLLLTISRFRLQLLKSGHMSQWANITLYTNMTNHSPFHFIYSQH
jgi:hypothetical protein